MEYLLPMRYQADNIWYGRDPDLHWSLRNSKDSSKGDRGVRLKSELGIKISDGFINFIKIFGYFRINT